MTINALRGRATPQLDADSLPIGEANREITACPNCTRPLASGAGRCPGCGVHLLLGVQIAKAATFVLFGVAGGILLGALIAGAIFATRAAPVAVPAASTAPVVSLQPVASTAPGGPGGTAIPTASLSALRQSAELNARLMAGVAALEVVLIDDDFDTTAAARTLRLLASDLAIGTDVAPRIGRWSAAADLGARLKVLYLEASAAAREGLSASHSNAAAYRAAAERMVIVLGGIAALDAESRDIAELAGVVLPTVTAR